MADVGERRAQKTRTKFRPEEELELRHEMAPAVIETAGPL
jgi:hypothetical protein